MLQKIFSTSLPPPPLKKKKKKQSRMTEHASVVINPSDILHGLLAVVQQKTLKMPVLVSPTQAAKTNTRAGPIQAKPGMMVVEYASFVFPEEILIVLTAAALRNPR